MLLFNIFAFLLQFCLISTESFHRALMGEYYLEWRALGPCLKEKRGSDEILTDIRITKKNRVPELVGDYTFKIPLDDSISAKCDFAVLGSNLAWLPNAYSLTFPKACSGFSNMMGPMWADFTKSMNMSSKCPIRKGVYELKGYDVNKFMRNSAFPKQFLYGRYQLALEFLNKKDELGEYYVEWRTLGPCLREKRGTDEILTDTRITKKNRIPELVGNYTFKIDLDDTISAKCDFAVLGSNLAWLPNAYTMTFPKACTGFSNMLGPIWADFAKSMNMSTKCPMQKGFYHLKGYDMNKILRNVAFPKQFIYGRYRITVEYLNKKEAVVGCSQFVIDFLPLWQRKKTKVVE